MRFRKMSLQPRESHKKNKTAEKTKFMDLLGNEVDKSNSDYTVKK